MADGRDFLQQWLVDLARDGWVTRRADLPELSKRLVDAQLPGLARRLDALAVEAPEPELLAERLGELHLLLAAASRLDELEAPLRADVLGLLGVSTRKQTVIESQPHVADRWWGLGSVLEEEGELSVRRTWLFGQRTGRAALLVSFAPVGRALPIEWPSGAAREARIAFYPSASPQRAVVVPDEESPPEPSRDGEEALSTWLLDLELAWAKRAEALERQPWLRRPMFGIRGLRLAEGEGASWLVDASGRGLRLADQDVALALAALSGGHPFGVWGEMDAGELRPFAAWAGGGLRCLLSEASR